MDRAANSNNIITGMSKVFPLLFLVGVLGGCMAFGPDHRPATNVVEEDLIGQWGCGRSLIISDLKTNAKYENARLIVKLHPDHSYEELLIHNRQKKVHRSTWQTDIQTSDTPSVTVKEWRYMPPDSGEFLPPQFDIELDEYDENKLCLRYFAAEGDGYCLYREYD